MFTKTKPFHSFIIGNASPFMSMPFTLFVFNMLVVIMQSLICNNNYTKIYFIKFHIKMCLILSFHSDWIWVIWHFNQMFQGHSHLAVHWKDFITLSGKVISLSSRNSVPTIFFFATVEGRLTVYKRDGNSIQFCPWVTD